MKEESFTMESDPEAANILFQITILVILTLINAFFAGSEMAVVSVNKNKIHVGWMSVSNQSIYNIDPWHQSRIHQIDRNDIRSFSYLKRSDFFFHADTFRGVYGRHLQKFFAWQIIRIIHCTAEYHLSSPHGVEHIKSG